ncbi:MAG: tetratricopeptide repeat protein [Pseudomonadota bacterium]
MAAVAGEGGRAALLLAGLLALAGCQVPGAEPPVSASEGATAGNATAGEAEAGEAEAEAEAAPEEEPEPLDIASLPPGRLLLVDPDDAEEVIAELAAASAGDAPQPAIFNGEIEPRVSPALQERPIERPTGWTWRQHGMSLLAAGKPRQAQEALERAMAVEGAETETLIAASTAAMMQGHLGTAERYLDVAARREPASVDVNIALGRLALARGQLDGARTAFRTAFLVSSGRSSYAALQLEETNRRIAARDALGRRTADQEAAVAFRTVRTGRSEYRLAPLTADIDAAVRPAMLQDGAVAALPAADAVEGAATAADEPSEVSAPGTDAAAAIGPTTQTGTRGGAAEAPVGG